MPANGLLDSIISGSGRRILSRAMLVSLILGAFWLTGCQSRPNPPQKPGAKVQSPVKKPETAIKVELERGRIIWDDEKGNRIMEAEYEKAFASREGEDSVTELQGASVRLYRNGKPSSRLEAPRVIADSRTKSIRASGGVKVVSAEQKASVQAEQLTWDSRTDMLTGKGAVKMIKNNMTITAGSFKADTALKKASFSDGSMSMD